MKPSSPPIWKNLQAILLLFVANSISQVAQGISMIAIPWYFAQSGETARFGWIYAIITIISLFWGPYSGTIVDRYNRKHIFLWLCTICGLLLFAVSSLGFYWGALPWYFVALVFLLTFMNYNLHYPNLYAFVQEITEKQHYGKVTSYVEIVGQVSSVLAGAGAALLLEGTKNGELTLFGIAFDIGWDIPKWDIHQIFFLDACTYVLAFLIIIFIKYKPLLERSTETGAVLDRLKVGLNYLRDNPYVFLFGVASYSIFVVTLLTTFYLAAKYVEAHLHMGGEVFASFEMFYAIGAVFAGLAIRWLFNKVTTTMSVIIMMFVTMAIYFSIAFTTNVGIFYLAAFFLGITNAGTRIQRITYLFNRVPNQVFGRASSIFYITNVLFRIGFLLLFTLAFFHEGNHVIYTFAILGLFLLLSALVLIKYYRKLVEA